MNSDLDELSCSRLHFIQSAMSLMQLVETDRRCWTSVELGRQKPYIPVSHRRKDARADHAWLLWLRGRQCIEETELVPGLSLEGIALELFCYTHNRTCFSNDKANKVYHNYYYPCHLANIVR